MLRKIWQAIVRFLRWLVGETADHIQPFAPPPRPVRTDAEYEAIFMQVLDGVTQGWSRGNIKGLLTHQNVQDQELIAWLGRFDERLQASPAHHAELARRLIQFGQIYSDALGAEAVKIGQSILAQIPPPPSEAGIWTGDVIEADFTGTPSDVPETPPDNQKNPEEAARDCFYHGVDLFNKGDFSAALAAFDQAVALMPEFPLAWNNRGLCLSNLGRHSEALESYDRALNHAQEEFPEVWENRSASLSNLGQEEAAQKSFERAIALKPQEPEPRTINTLPTQQAEAKTSFYQGVQKFNQGDFAAALVEFDRAVELMPEFALAWNNRGICLANLGRHSEALESYDHALNNADQELAEVLENRGVSLSSLGREQEAQAAYQQAFALKTQGDSFKFQEDV